MWCIPFLKIVIQNGFYVDLHSNMKRHLGLNIPPRIYVHLYRRGLATISSGLWLRSLPSSTHLLNYSPAICSWGSRPWESKATGLLTWKQTLWNKQDFPSKPFLGDHGSGQIVAQKRWRKRMTLTLWTGRTNKTKAGQGPCVRAGTGSKGDRIRPELGGPWLKSTLIGRSSLGEMGPATYNWFHRANLVRGRKWREYLNSSLELLEESQDRNKSNEPSPMCPEMHLLGTKTLTNQPG